MTSDPEELQEPTAAADPKQREQEGSRSGLSAPKGLLGSSSIPSGTSSAPGQVQNQQDVIVDLASAHTRESVSPGSPSKGKSLLVTSAQFATSLNLAPPATTKVSDSNKGLSRECSPGVQKTVQRTTTFDCHCGAPIEITVEPLPESPKKELTPVYEMREYYWVLLGGVCLAFNAGYINGICLSGLMVDGERIEQPIDEYTINIYFQALRHNPRQGSLAHIPISGWRLRKEVGPTSGGILRWSCLL